MLSSCKSKKTASVFQHPKPFYIIFLIEMWERFGFYVVQSLLVFFLIKELKMTEAQSFLTYGAFSSLLWGGASIGGYIADNLLGIKRTIILGAMVLALGYALVALSEHNREQVFIGLAAIACGNGLFKANPSSLLCKIYSKSESYLLDGAFAMYYMAINIGSMLATAFAPMVAAKYGFKTAFLMSTVGLVLALVNFIASLRWMKNAGSALDFKPINYKNLAYVLIGTLIAIVCSALIMQHVIMVDILLSIVSFWVIYLFIKYILQAENQERKKLLVAYILIFQAILFWVLYHQMPMSLNLFAVHNVDPTIFGLFKINPLSFQVLNPLWIVIISPVLAFVLNLNNLGTRPLSMPSKFALGMFISSSAFLVIPIGAHFANANGIVSSNWIILTYFLQALGELFIGAMGLSMIGKLVPKRMHGFLMGSWFLSAAIGAIVAGYLGSFAAIPQSEGLESNHLLSLNIYSNYFMKFGISAMVISVIIFFVNKKLTKIIAGDPLNNKANDSTAIHKNIGC